MGKNKRLKVHRRYRHVGNRRCCLGSTGYSPCGCILEFCINYKLKYPASDDWAILAPADGNGVQLSLSKVSSPKAKRHHLDLFTDHQEAEVERLLALGAARKEWRYPDGADYVVLQDPDGNPFCVVQR